MKMSRNSAFFSDSDKARMLINVKMKMIVGILTIMTRNMSWAWKLFYNLGVWTKFQPDVEILSKTIGVMLHRTLQLSWYDWTAVEKEVRLQVIHPSIYQALGITCKLEESLTNLTLIAKYVLSCILIIKWSVRSTSREVQEVRLSPENSH